MKEDFRKCSLCGVKKHFLELSKQGFCYACSKKRLLVWFEAAWEIKYERCKHYESTSNL